MATLLAGLVTNPAHIFNQAKIEIARKMDDQQIFNCPICGNTDAHSLGKLNGRYYCRKCLMFKGEEAKSFFAYPKGAPIQINYNLSEEQKELSNRLVDNFKQGVNSLVYAVTGSGKTEICLRIIQCCIERGLKVGFAVPRSPLYAVYF